MQATSSFRSVSNSTIVCFRYSTGPFLRGSHQNVSYTPKIGSVVLDILSKFTHLFASKSLSSNPDFSTFLIISEGRGLGTYSAPYLCTSIVVAYRFSYSGVKKIIILHIVDSCQVFYNSFNVPCCITIPHVNCSHKTSN